MSFWKRKAAPAPTPAPVSTQIGETVQIYGERFILVGMRADHDYVQMTYQTVAAFDLNMRIERAPLN